MQPKTIGPILNSRVEPSVYAVLAVWVSKRAATDWALSHGWKARDVFKILAGSNNMTFTQWILRDPAGMALTEAGVKSLESE